MSKTVLYIQKGRQVKVKVYYKIPEVQPDLDSETKGGSRITRPEVPNDSTTKGVSLVSKPPRPKADLLDATKGVRPKRYDLYLFSFAILLLIILALAVLVYGGWIK